jgi:hypothetical protein
MSKKRQITRENWDFSYNGRDDDHNDIKRFNLSFENPGDDEEIVEQLNTFLQAIGRKSIIARTL